MPRRSLKELINTEDPGWPLVQAWIAAAHNHVEVLAPNPKRAEEVLLHLQVTTRSPLGAIAFETGGLFIDHGWLRFLGSGNERMLGDLLSWNTVGEVLDNYLLKDAWVVAHDVMGGFFALNSGAFPVQPGTAFYFAPDTLKWENTNLSYSQLLSWALAGDIDLFYKKMRWPSWEQEVSPLSGDQGLSIYPFPFLQGTPFSERSRRVVSMNELWRLNFVEYSPKTD